MPADDFVWEDARPLSPTGLLLATFLPSALAFAGFHRVLPALVEAGVPVLVGWPVVATVSLALFSAVAILLLRREAATLGISLWSRMCLRNPDGKTWLISLGVTLVQVVVTVQATAIVGPLRRLVGFEIPAYMPFFLDPEIDPTTASIDVLSPGFPLVGETWLIGLLAVTLFFNILTEELYFRAWMLPKLSHLGAWAWVVNGVLFALYHTFQLWLLPVLLVGSLGTAFVCHYSRSIWPAVVVHTLMNLLTVAGVAALVLGWIP